MIPTTGLGVRGTEGVIKNAGPTGQGFMECT